MARILLAAIVCFVCSLICYADDGVRYIGCYEDRRQRILEGNVTITNDMTVEKCVQICTYKGYFYAGVEFYSQCFCGNQLKQYNKLDDSECHYHCYGNSSQKCGAAWKISVYTTKANVGYRFIGCFEDTIPRMLEGKFTEGGMTVDKCVQTCSNEGDYYAGVEFYNQCFCGNQLQQYKKTDGNECSYNCVGDSSQKCGAAWKISVYTTYGDMGSDTNSGTQVIDKESCKPSSFS